MAGFVITSVKTKINDGGISTGKANKGATTSTRDIQNDAFLRYSNDDIRMAELLGLSSANADWRQLRNFQGQARVANLGDQGNANEEGQAAPRKTRLSFEVHDSLFSLMFLNENDEAPSNM